MRFLKEFLTALLVMAFSMAVSAKVNVTNGDYKLAEVTGNNINIRSGAGTEYPIAYQYVGFSYDVNTGTESATKENVPPAEKARDTGFPMQATGGRYIRKQPRLTKTPNSSSLKNIVSL